MLQNYASEIHCVFYFFRNCFLDDTVQDNNTSQIIGFIKYVLYMIYVTLKATLDFFLAINLKMMENKLTLHSDT